METTDRTGDANGTSESAPDESAPTISAYSTSKERVVFTESDNGDGWIATDLTVEPER